MASGGSNTGLPAKAAPAMVKPKAKPPPAALQRQAQNASSRWDDSGSVSSWVRLDEEAPSTGTSATPVVSAANQVPQPTSSDASQADQPQMVPPPPPAGGPPSSFPTASNAAPAVQAAQSLLDHSNEAPASRRLRRQQEQAARRGRRAMRWGQMAPGDLAHKPLNTQLPGHRLDPTKVKDLF